MNHTIKKLSTLLMVLVMVATLAPSAGTANAVDLAQTCSIIALTGESYDDIEDLQLDVYYIASAEPVPGFDTYTYSFGAGFASLKDILDECEDGFYTLEISEKVAKKAAKIIFDGNDSFTPVETGSADQKIVLNSGLYLVVPHGRDLQNYISHDPDGNIISIYKSSTYKYVFSPVLVSLPVEDRKTSDENTTKTWIYDAQMTLKPGQEVRNGSVEIIADLTGYVEGNPANVVFSISAVLDGEIVYTNAAAITFDSAGQRSLRIDDIPVGSEITVTNTYDGTSYRIITAAKQNCVVSAEDIVSVSFTFEPIDRAVSGGGIDNRYIYTENGWSWEKIKLGASGNEEN